MVLENRLKPDSAAVIDQLIAANFKTVMITGDNLLTAVNIARQCGMVGINDQVVIVSCDDAIKSKSGGQRTKPELIYTLADNSMLPSNRASVAVDLFVPVWNFA